MKCNGLGKKKGISLEALVQAMHFHDRGYEDTAKTWEVGEVSGF